jgi:hypothetical protein
MVRFIAVFLTTAALAFALLLPVRGVNRTDLPRLARMASAPGRVVMLGDSVIAGYSHCDTNTASIPEMLAAALHEPVVDASRPGSVVGASLDALRVAVSFRHFRLAVVPVTVNSELFTSVSGDSDAARLWRDVAGSLRYAPKPAPQRTPFKGRVYGDYDELTTRYFPKEKAASTCPEEAGSDLAFVEYMYWKHFGQPLNAADGFDAFVGRVQSLQARGIATLAVLPPVDHQLIETLNDPPVMSNLRQATAETGRLLEAARIPFVDLTFALPSGAFADPYCACGHLNAPGREEYARRVAERARGLLDARPD